MNYCTYAGHRWTTTPSKILRGCKDCTACQIYKNGQWQYVEKAEKNKPMVESPIQPELWKEAQ